MTGWLFLFIGALVLWLAADLFITHFRTPPRKQHHHNERFQSVRALRGMDRRKDQ